jgi:ribosomal protein L40E
MPASTFQLIFDSRQVATNEHDALKKRLQSRLGMEAHTLERLFGGRPVVIRRNLSTDQARRLAERLGALGAPCRIAAQTHPQTQKPHLSDSLVVCPKCQHNQSPAEECRRCGLIFSKFRPGKPLPASPPPAPEPAGMEPAPREREVAVPQAPWTQTKVGKALSRLQAIKTRLEAPFRRGRTQGHRSAPPYLRVVVSESLRAVLYAVIALLLLVAGMWFARGLWGLYTATQVGEQYVAKFPEKAQAIVMVLGQHSLVLPVATILATLLVGTCVATGAQFLHLARYFYLNRPWWWRLLLWYLPLTVATGVVLNYIGLAPSLELGTALALLPTLCLAPAAFDLGQALICEIGDLLARLRALVVLPSGIGGWSRQLARVRERIVSQRDR